MENIRESFFADRSDYYEQLFAEMKNGNRKTPILLQQRGAGLVDGLTRIAIPVVITGKKGSHPEQMLAVFHTEQVKKAKKRKLPQQKRPIKRKRIIRQKGKGFEYPLFMNESE